MTRGTLLVTLALFAASCNSGPPEASDPGVPAARAYASAYVAALQAEDPMALGKVIDRPVNSTEVTERLRLYGDIRQPEVSILHEFPLIFALNITGTRPDGQPIHINETLEWHGHWFTSTIASPSPEE
jgi:hypothetical protein